MTPRRDPKKRTRGADSREIAQPGIDPQASEKLFPIAAERALIGHLILHPAALTEVTLPAGDLHSMVPRKVFEAIRSITESGCVVTFPAITAAVQQFGISPAEVSALSDASFRGARWQGYQHLVREGAARRRLYYAAQAMLDNIAYEEIDELRAGMYATLEHDTGHAPPEEDRFDRVLTKALTEPTDYVRTLIDGVDDRIYGVPRGSLVIIGARTSVGKTALAVDLATKWVKAGRRVSFLSLEMSAREVVARFAGSMTGIPVMDVHRRAADVTEQVVQGAALHLADRRKMGGVTLPILKARAHQHARLMGGIDALIVDYVQLVDPVQRIDESRYQAVGRISTELKDLGAALNCIVFAPAQVGRSVEDRTGADQAPRLSDLRESGNLEQDADHVWFVWKERRRKAKGLDPSATERTIVPGWRPVKLSVAKNRFGPVGTIDIQFDPVTMQFHELAAEE